MTGSGLRPKPAKTTDAPAALPNVSRHRIKIRSRSPFLAVFQHRQRFIGSAVSGRLCGVILMGECYEQTDKPDTCREKFLDDAIAAAERASGKKLNQPNRHIVLNRARAQIESQRYADRQRALREDERQQSEFAWSRPRAPRR